MTADASPFTEDRYARALTQHDITLDVPVLRHRELRSRREVLRRRRERRQRILLLVLLVVLALVSWRAFGNPAAFVALQEGGR